jgi:hypothetical protein
MASFKTILSDIGTGLKKFFGIAVDAAKAAEPIVDIAFPGISVLYNATVNEVASAEAAAIAAGAQSGTGAQKLALVVAAVTPYFQQYATAQGLPAPTVATITAWVNAVVAGLNAIPSATA